MNILEKLENSYNRQIQKLVINQLDIIDGASKDYTTQRIKYKLSFLEKANPIASNLIREKALLKNYKKECRDSFRKLKNKYKNDIASLKETKDFAIKEAKLSLTLINAKIKNNYKKARSEYLTSIKLKKEEQNEKLRNFINYHLSKEPNIKEVKKEKRILVKFTKKFKINYQEKQEELKKELDLFEKQTIDKLKIFEKEFSNYYQEELKELIVKRDQSIVLIIEQYQIDCQEKVSKYHDDKIKLTDQFIKVNEVKFKEEKKTLIKRYQEEIKILKQQMKQNEMGQSEYLKAFKKETQNIKRKARLSIKGINKEVRKKVNQMSNEEKREFNELQKYINEDYRLRRKVKLDHKEALIVKKINPAYIYVAPAFLGEVFFTLLPFIFMIVGSLFRVDFNNLSKSKWLGLQNFIRIFTKDVEFQKAVSNTIIYSFITVILLTVVTISMAAWLAKNTKIHNLAQTMVFTPHIASLVSISILWIAMLNPNGIINQILHVFGIKGPAWLLQENTSLFAVSLVTVWKDIGYYVLIIISGLQGIPTYVYEAAKLDKASKSATFFKITLPLLAPTLSFVFLTKFINSFKVFAPIEIMTNGGPMGSSMVLSYWIYKVGRIGFNYGQAMAGALVLTIMIAICTMLNNRYFKRIVRY